jgi:hypothetical protein
VIFNLPFNIELHFGCARHHIDMSINWEQFLEEDYLNIDLWERMMIFMWPEM